MAILNLNTKEVQLNFGKDCIITQKWIAGIKGGRALDMTDWPLDVVPAGLPIIVKDANYKPMPVVIATEDLPTAAVSSQTAGQAISGTVYEGVTATTEGAVKCAKSDKTIVYLAGSAATGTASADKTYYTKDTSNKTTVDKLDENGNTYYVIGSLPANHSYVGILYKSILAKKPAASIMTWGIVNEAALPYSISSIKSAFLSACPHIQFVQDEEAAAAE